MAPLSSLAQAWPLLQVQRMLRDEDDSLHMLAWLLAAVCYPCLSLLSHTSHSCLPACLPEHAVTAPRSSIVSR